MGASIKYNKVKCNNGNSAVCLPVYLLPGERRRRSHKDDDRNNSTICDFLFYFFGAGGWINSIQNVF